MTRKIHLALAALGAFGLFALALWAGGDAALVVARDRTDADVGRLMSQIVTPPAATVAQAKTPGNAKTTKKKKDATSGNSKSATESPASPGSNFIGGVPRGSFDDESRRNEDATRGSHADSGA